MSLCASDKRHAVNPWAYLTDLLDQLAAKPADVTLDDLGSPIGQFVADRCIVDPEATVPKVEIYSAWKSWCEESGHISGSDANFAKSLLASVTGLDDARPVQGNLRVRVWVGVRLQTYLDDEADERTEVSKGTAWTVQGSRPCQNP